MSKSNGTKSPLPGRQTDDGTFVGMRCLIGVIVAVAMTSPSGPEPRVLPVLMLLLLLLLLLLPVMNLLVEAVVALNMCSG